MRGSLPNKGGKIRLTCILAADGSTILLDDAQGVVQPLPPT